MQFILAALLLVSVGADDWQPLFNGTDYAGFTFWIPGGPEETFLIEDGCMAIKPVKAGFAYTRRKYRNYELSYDWRFEKPSGEGAFTGNGGVLLHITIPLLKAWPRSIEVDAKSGEEGKLVVHEKKAGEITFEGKDDPAARKAAMKPPGEWNTTHVWCKEGEIKVTLNGKLVAEGKTSQQEGAIGFMSQGSVMYYRNIKVKEIK
jgi:hypothetical protein